MLSLENITKKYGDVTALERITFALSLNEIMAVVGPSGCGKTTLLRLIAGLEQPDEGKINIEGIEVSSSTRMLAPNKRKLSMIFQDLALWPHMTVREHIKFVIKGRNGLIKNDIGLCIDRILEDVNMKNYGNRSPHELSGGEKQRLAIARALAARPTYLLMDEPFSNLDTILKEDLQDLILRLKNEYSMGIIYVTHNIEEVLALADRIAVINNGKFEQVGDKDNVFANPKNDFVRRILKVK